MTGVYAIDGFLVAVFVVLWWFYRRSRRLTDDNVDNDTL